MNDALVARIQALPCFAGITGMLALGGGMTDYNWRVDDRQGCYVGRLGQDVPEHGILRWHDPQGRFQGEWFRSAWREGQPSELAANWIDDGRRLWLIDWGCAGFNSRLFDPANLSCNNGFDAAPDRELPQRCFGNAPDTALTRAFLALRCASAMRECLWAVVSLQVSTLDVDYRDYARNWCAGVEACRLDFEAGRRQP